ncbi:IspD/TarI family cytidylyltransferase [Nitriliruptor alkaliphilus]|uniref:IspD/TarI family cytidylyltransferase n=1 Tax=Nitriliruptor alkaliphilus TaxID=427918 RepID=UPI000698A9F7|nr:2-C-methyl-D-erythritol 4-phosphate cytidylyltransferase [Nitriliruptor alkaliphilus]
MTAAHPAGAQVGAVVVAAGRGERLGGGVPKALVEVGGRTLVARAVDGLRRAGVATIVVVHPPSEADAFAAVLHDTSILAPGGEDRSASVRAGLDALPPDVTLVAVHDAARAFTPPEVIAAAIRAVTGDVVAAAPALPVADTLKRVDGDDVVATLDRAGVVAVQTPQVFPRAVIRAVGVAGASATDDLGLVEARLAAGELDGRVVWVPGSPRALKVTYPDDLVIAEALARGEASAT